MFTAERSVGRPSRLFLSQKEAIAKIPLAKTRVSSAAFHRFCWLEAKQLHALVLNCDDSGACGKQDQIHQSRPSRSVQVVSMDHKQNNDQLLVDERSGQISQSPSKYSVGNTEDTHFNPPPPSPWKRVALIVLICFLFYLGFSMRSTLLRDKKHDIVYASR